MLKENEQEWEAIRLEFIAEHEAGKQPTIEDFAKRYPQYSSELVDFILDYLHMENRVKRLERRRNA